MRSFGCRTCGQLLFFPNDTCLGCGSWLGWRPSTGALEVLDPADRRCGNHAVVGCNWLVEDDAALCVSCRQTRTTPPQDDPELLAAWRETEAAKRQVLAQLLGLGLPVDVTTYDLVSSRVDDEVMIGHADGVVTIDVDETDDARRERLRDRLDEPYRTVLGHLRHELGHALFDLLVVGFEDEVRQRFGDWTVDYGAALDRHYAEGPPPGWQAEHVSAYATMHPAEDWAETFAHHLHITDVLETARSFGLQVTGTPDAAWAHARALAGVDEPWQRPDEAGFRHDLATWLPLTYALNAINRSMGQDDLYPFVLTDPVIDKLVLVDRTIRAASIRD